MAGPTSCQPRKSVQRRTRPQRRWRMWSTGLLLWPDRMADLRWLTFLDERNAVVGMDALDPGPEPRSVADGVIMVMHVIEEGFQYLDRRPGPPISAVPLPPEGMG